jgi:hypothetical protein
MPASLSASSFPRTPWWPGTYRTRTAPGRPGPASGRVSQAALRAEKARISDALDLVVSPEWRRTAASSLSRQTVTLVAYFARGFCRAASSLAVAPMISASYV